MNNDRLTAINLFYRNSQGWTGCKKIMKDFSVIPIKKEEESGMES